MNTKLYKNVHSLANDLLDAANKDDTALFKQHYNALKALCEENEDGDKNHPVQWETLADFTEEVEDALVYYEKALTLAHEINANDYITSINYAMASMLNEFGKTHEALEAAKQADKHANKQEDDELKQEVKNLIQILSAN